MGLFDNFQFDPQSFGGTEGLLSMLTRFQQQGGANEPSPLDTAQWPAGPVGNYGQDRNVAVGNYQMPQFGTAPAPDPAAIPQNAQLAQFMPKQQQAPQQQESPGIGDRIGAGLSGFVNAGGPLQAIGNLVSGVATGTTPENQTVKALVARGLDPATAQTIARDPSLLRAAIPQLMGTTGQTDDIKEYQFAKREDPTLTFEKFMQRKRSVSGEFGMQPIWGVGPDGKPAVMQLGKNGAAVASRMPEGFSLARDPVRVEGPTGTVILDPQTRQQVGFIPKDVAGKEALEKTGQARGTAQAALANGADIDAEATKRKIDEFINHKGFSEVFGQLDQYRPSFTHSNEGADALARYKQLKGVTFLTAYQMLKGGGAITDIEGQRAGDAMARLDRAQSEEEAKTALRDFREAVDMGLTKLRRAAGSAESSSPARTPTTATPSVDDLLKKYGG